ncbi:MAG TPA: PAS domain-containing sensor histidine kinase [Trichormus sp.]|jgi:PAS domain S-box-containing protein
MTLEPPVESRLARKTVLLLIALGVFNACLLSALSCLLFGIELHWHQINADDAMRLTKVALIAGLAGNALLGAAFVGYFHRQITKRLEHLLRNIDLVGQGQTCAAVEGQDEIAKIDSSFRKLAESLRESAEKERAITDYASDVICCFELSGQCISINPSCKRLWGYDPEELIGQNIFDLVTPEDRQRLAGNVRSVLGKAGPGNYELRIRKKDGNLSDTMWSLYWSSERLWIVAVIYDITPRKTQERAQAEFTAMVSHDLRSPLATVQMFLQAIEMQVWGGVPAEYIKQSARSRQLLEHLMTITEQILSYEKVAATDFTLELQEVELSQVVDTAAFAVEGLAAKKKVTIAVEPTDTGVQLVADKERLTQVLINLLSNAIKFSPAGEKVSVSTAADATFVTVQVRDKGPGVSDDEKGRIFDKFAQSSDTKALEGTGLGLAICKQIIERHGGRIGVSDAQGGGSLFWVKIPKTPV